MPELKLEKGDAGRAGAKQQKKSKKKKHKEEEDRATEGLNHAENNHVGEEGKEGQGEGGRKPAQEKKTQALAFKVKDLFAHPFQELLVQPVDPSLQLTPQEFYDQVRALASKRFEHELPGEQVALLCMANKKKKAAVLRDLCLSVGLQIHARDYFAGAAREGEARYASLPFRREDLVELHPVVHTSYTSDAKSYMTSAKSALKEGFVEQAFEGFSQALNLYLQITGPMNKDVATCIEKIANIHFRMGDFQQAIALQIKVVVLCEKLHGLIHPQTANAYSNLGLYHHSAGLVEKGFDFMFRALYILPDNHPEICAIYVTLGLMYQDTESNQAAIDCFL